MATMLEMPEEQATAFDSWPALWRWLAPRLAEEGDKQIIILDELSYASAADPALLSALQHAWDHHLQESNVVLVLCGSQVTTMEAIMQHQSPLFGRFTGQWHLQPLPFSSLREFFPHLSSLMSPEETTAHIKSELRAFVGLSFEKLAQQWVVAQARAGGPSERRLPFVPEAVGSHWSRQVQVDVVAINHQSREILLGECKWGEGKVNRQLVRELIEQKGPKVRQELRDGKDWTFHYSVFARAGFTAAAAAELNARGLLVDLPVLDEVLSA